tara:strand:+ start:111 stop:1076 length:966 start_codon:yes stop_codon:yes gene_type:complete
MMKGSSLSSLQEVNIDVPKNMFTYWHQGTHKLPRFAKALVSMWEKLNPGWTLYVLDQGSVKPWLTEQQNTFLDSMRIPKIAHYSDMIRTYLLLNHGGVWFDVTLLPLRPLEYWDFDLGELSAYKYEYQNYVPNRENIGERGANGSPVINFFLAAQKDSYYLQKMSHVLELYLQRTDPESRPYLYWQYEFDQLIMTDRKFQQWFYESSTGTTIHTACNLVDGGYPNLARSIEDRNPGACSACLKLGLRDDRRFYLETLDLASYYTSLGVDVSEMRFSAVFPRPLPTVGLIVLIFLMIIIVVCLVCLILQKNNKQRIIKKIHP